MLYITFGLGRRIVMHGDDNMESKIKIRELGVLKVESATLMVLF